VTEWVGSGGGDLHHRVPGRAYALSGLRRERLRASNLANATVAMFSKRLLAVRVEVSFAAKFSPSQEAAFLFIVEFRAP